MCWWQKPGFSHQEGNRFSVREQKGHSFQMILCLLLKQPTSIIEQGNMQQGFEVNMAMIFPTSTNFG